ncbi:Mediator of RNA polymerase II transcription subunit 19 [Hirsutella minnesotensis 3608]|uniref:Mediator of RNA polymerase II transcription subunit 19 n=1 Tax=Hirsutella minnesotensis 3608 TaxID=1043627 RepID=A0A0F7ZZG0_9HYPO|nr:Mediator of RNA polymerase II transcription subunit 19 [Hirsutella minnesotensis 3608]
MTFHPQTPQSPCHFSPATSSDHTTSLASGSIATSTTTLPTPAHSVNGASSQSDVVMIDESPNKRKRALDDVGGDRDHKKMHLEDRKLGIEDLHLDVGEKYMLCQTLHPPSLPRTSDDLYEMFGLTGLAAEVAREKPNGEKNALRKTYKGHIKRLGVAGHFDVQKKKEDAPSEFMELLNVPELEWNVHQVKGREIGDGLAEATLAGLGRAMTMARGPVPKGIWDSSVLGDLAPSNQDTSKSVSAKPTAPNTPLTSTPNTMGRSKSQLPPGHDPNRPRRNVKKRSYGDSSFEGYGEGFPDDDAGVEMGYSTGEGEGGQKRRKKSSGNSPQYPAMRQQSYGPGMVGA